MDAGVPDEPLQERRQVVVRRTFEARVPVAPIRRLRPISLFKVVVHVEQRDADPGSERHWGEVDPKEVTEAERSVNAEPDREQGHVHQQDAVARFRRRLGQVEGQAETDVELERRPDAEQHERVAVGAIRDAPEPRLALILARSEHVDLADAAAIEAADRRVVRRVRAAPVRVGHEGQHAEYPAYPIVGGARAEERAVTAVVLDREQPQQEAGRGQREREAHPISALCEQPHPEAEAEEPGKVAHQLGDAAPRDRFAVRGEGALPLGRRGRGRGRERIRGRDQRSAQDALHAMRSARGEREGAVRNCLGRAVLQRQSAKRDRGFALPAR